MGYLRQVGHASIVWGIVFLVDLLYHGPSIGLNKTLEMFTGLVVEIPETITKVSIKVTPMLPITYFSLVVIFCLIYFFIAARDKKKSERVPNKNS